MQPSTNPSPWQTEQAQNEHRQWIASLTVSADLARPVFGDGPTDARLILIGEAPGAQEAESGRPFVGKAGKQLDAFLQAVGLERQRLYVTNAVKYRPIKPGSKANRTPTRSEINQSRPFLMEELSHIQADWIATLGNSPLYALTQDPSLRIGDVHGQSLLWEGRRLLPLYHPASVIYNQSLKACYAEDLQTLARYLSAP